MADTPLPPTSAALRHRREFTIARLCEHFARDNLEAHELEELIDRAHQAVTIAALDNLLVGLPELEAAKPAQTAMVPAGAAGGQHQVVVAVMGGAERKGAWSPASNLYVVACMGGSLLDFREAQLGPGVTNLMVLAVMGGVEIIVPPGLRVESNGIGIMGGFEHAGQHSSSSSEGPILRISGAAIMGGVEIKEKPPKTSLPQPTGTS
jgi:hypothetical protein